MFIRRRRFVQRVAGGLAQCPGEVFIYIGRRVPTEVGQHDTVGRHVVGGFRLAALVYVTRRLFVVEVGAGRSWVQEVGASGGCRRQGGIIERLVGRCVLLVGWR